MKGDYLNVFILRFISDTTPAIFAVVLLFICPGANIFKGHPYRNLIEWRVLQKLFPWNIIFLSAGSLAIADGFQVIHYQFLTIFY